MDRENTFILAFFFLGKNYSIKKLKKIKKSVDKQKKLSYNKNRSAKRNKKSTLKSKQ